MAVTTASLRRLTPVDSGRRRSNNGAMDDAQLKEFGVRLRRRREAPEVGSVIDRILDRVRPEDYAEVVRTVLRDIDAFVEEVSAEAPEAAPQRPAAHRRPKHR